MRISEKVKYSFIRRVIASILIGKWISKYYWQYKVDEQVAKVLLKYGQYLDDCPNNKYNWEVMMLEELIDYFNYKLKNK